MKIFVSIILQVLIYSQTLAQYSTLSCDSICLNNLTIKDTDALRYIEKELLKNSISDDTLFLSIYNLYDIGKDEISDKNFLFYLSGNENYNTYVKDISCKGYLNINNVCIIVINSDQLNKLNMFEYNDSICKNFNYTYDNDRISFLVVGSKIELIYKVRLKRNNKIAFRRKRK